MPRDRDHFELPTWQEAFPRRLRGGGRPPQRDRPAHGRALLNQADHLVHELEERRHTAPPGINPKLVFKLRLHRDGTLDEEQLRRIGLHILARDSEKAIVVFPDQPSLDELRRRLREYAGEVPGGREYSYLAALETIEELTPDDRVGPRL